MKVAFGSATARFKGQEFFPIGAHKSVLPRGDHQDGANKTKKRQGSANQKIVSSTATAIVRKASKAGPVLVATAATTDPLANLNRTHAKLFVIPRQHQTKQIPSVPDVALLPDGTDQRPAPCETEHPSEIFDDGDEPKK